MKNELILAAVDATSNRTSGFTDLVDLTTYAIEVVFTGGAGNLAGTLKLQANLNQTSATDPTPLSSSWVDITGSTQAITASSNHIWDVVRAGYRFVRAVWTFSSGTGDIEMRIHIKSPVVTYP